MQTLFTKNDAYKILNFIKTWDENNTIIIHCWCGVSRSMATAAFLLCSLDKSNIDRNVRYMRKIAPHSQPNTLMLKYFEELLNINNEISLSFEKYPKLKSYDCENNFAPVTLFDIKEMKQFK